MLTEFEDRTPASSTLVDKAFVAFAVFGSALAVIGLASTVLAWGVGIKHWLSLAG